jgi:hypothetical protein
MGLNDYKERPPAITRAQHATTMRLAVEYTTNPRFLGRGRISLICEVPKPPVTVDEGH